MVEFSIGHGLGFAFTGFPKISVDDANQNEGDDASLAFHRSSPVGAYKQLLLVFYCLVFCGHGLIPGIKPAAVIWNGRCLNYLISVCCPIVAGQ